MRRNFYFAIFAFIITGLTACSILDRHPESGYFEYSQSTPGSVQYYQEKKNYQNELARNDLGLRTSRALSDQERGILDKRLWLGRLETNLGSRRAKKQYYSYKAQLKSDANRIRFLSIPSVEGRERWIQKLGIFNQTKRSPAVAKAIGENDIIRGMNKKSVRESWGNPEAVEFAGDPVYGNERWKYKKMVSSQAGYAQEMRMIYFEAGRVVGWEKF